MNTLTNQQKTKIYEEEKWKWRGRTVPLGKMDTMMLDQCLKFVKQYPSGNSFGKRNQYWKQAIEHMIKVKSKQDVNHVISNIVKQEVLTHRVNHYINSLIDNSKGNLKVLNQYK